MTLVRRGAATGTGEMKLLAPTSVWLRSWGAAYVPHASPRLGVRMQFVSVAVPVFSRMLAPAPKNTR